MKVFAVLDTDDDLMEINDIFSNEESAKKYVSKHKTLFESLEIDEFEVSD